MEEYKGEKEENGEEEKGEEEKKRGEEQKGEGCEKRIALCRVTPLGTHDDLNSQVTDT